MKMSERYHSKLSGRPDIESTEYNGILVQLEVTNACNHKCYFCPNRNSIRDTKMMDFDFAKRIIRECKELIGKDSKICFHMNGEPLLYKRLPELIEFSKELGYEYCFVTTNGSVATDSLLKELFDSGLDSIKYSINAGTRETYNKIHGKDDWDKVISSLKFASRYRKESNKNYCIYVSCVGTRDNINELEGLKAEVDEYCDEIVFYYPCGYAGQNNALAKEIRCDMSGLDIKTFDILHSRPCNVLWNSINVTCEGYLSLCCSESDNRLVVEDLNKMSVREAWLGHKMSSIRNKHLNGDIADTPCLSCVEGADYTEELMNRDLFELSLSVRNSKKRIKSSVEKISYDETRDFFKNRALKFNEENPYSVTMYQDNNPELVIKRNISEIAVLKPLLNLNEASSVLDIACGIGRWADSIDENINKYCGIDFSPELIEIACKRNADYKNKTFLVGAANETKKVLFENNQGKFNVALLIGILMYLNEKDVADTLMQVADVLEEEAVICIREPVGLDDRLTLKSFYSQELKDNYNAIYRTRDELMDMFAETLIKSGFKISQEGFLFTRENLNNRKETEQYYYIFRR